MNLSNAFHLDRRILISIILVISALLTLTRPYQIDSLFAFLNLLGVIVPPLAGIILSDFYIVHHGNYESLDSAQLKDWTLSPWLTWLVSYGIVFGLQKISFGLPALNGIVAAVILYPILNKSLSRK